MGSDSCFRVVENRLLIQIFERKKKTLFCLPYHSLHVMMVDFILWIPIQIPCKECCIRIHKLFINLSNESPSYWVFHKSFQIKKERQDLKQDNLLFMDSF